MMSANFEYGNAKADFRSTNTLFSGVKEKKQRVAGIEQAKNSRRFQLGAPLDRMDCASMMHHRATPSERFTEMRKKIKNKSVHTNEIMASSRPSRSVSHSRMQLDSPGRSSICFSSGRDSKTEDLYKSTNKMYQTPHLPKSTGGLG
jgi:predicted HTH transcriptional regulator